MKKHKNFTVKFLFCLISIMTIFFSGCQSLPEENIVEPIYLLSAENSVFYSVPSDFDDELVKKIISNYLNDFQQKDFDLLKKYIDKIYAASSISKNNEMEIVVSGSFPVTYINSSLKNNPKFIKSTITDDTLSKKYIIYNYDEYQICIVSKKFIFISQNIHKMLKNYETLMNINNSAEQYRLSYDTEYYEFFNDGEKSIKIFINSVNTWNDLLKGLGINLTFNFKEIKYVQDIYNDDIENQNYTSNIKLILENPKTAKLFKTMFSVMLAMSNSNSQINVNENTVEVNNFLVSKETIINYFNKK